ncbi:MAG: restriction endonuclease subunit S [Bacteroidia bacterium]
MITENIDCVGIELYSRWKEYKAIDTPFGTIAEDWSYIPSLQFCTKITDGTHDSPKQQKAGKHLVTSKHIKGRNIDFETAYLISEKDFDNINLRSKVEQWDVIVSMIGEYCGFTYVERNESIAYAVKNVGLFKTGSEHKAMWLFYYLNSKIGRHILEINKSGTSQPYLTLGFLRELPILYPSSSVEANHIIQILTSLDDKIDLLHRQNLTLEQLAETLFRQWFVEEAEESWEEISLSEIAEIKAGGDKPKVFSEIKTNECTFPIYSNGIDNDGLYGYTNTAKIFDESITVSARGTIGFVCLRLEPYVPIVRLISVIPKKNKVSCIYLYLWAKSQNISGTGTTQEQLTVPDFSGTTLLLPTFDKMIEFTDCVNEFFQKIKSNQTQIRTLTQTRDTLLPKLMSGEVRVESEKLKVKK